MRKLCKWVARKATQGLLWVAVKTCQAIIFVVDVAAALVEVVKETVQTAVEVTVEIIKRARKNPVVQNIRKGLDIVKKVKDLKEFPGTIKRAVKVGWAFATGKACFSWVASSGWCTLCAAGYAVLLVASCAFSLYLLGLLSTAFRS
jgi:hypothetical protein